MEFLSRADQRVLRWFGHVERLDEYRMARRVLMAEVSGGRVQRRQRLGWMDGVKVALGNRGMMVRAACQCAKDQKYWRALVHLYLSFTWSFLLGPVFFRTALPCSGGYHLEGGWDAITGCDWDYYYNKATTIIKAQMSSIMAKGCLLMIVCLLSDLT